MKCTQFGDVRTIIIILRHFHCRNSELTIHFNCFPAHTLLRYAPTPYCTVLCVLTLRRRSETTQGLISCISCFYYSKSEICETIFTLMMMSFCWRGRSPNSELHTDTQFPVLNGVSLWKRNRREIYRPQ